MQFSESALLLNRYWSWLCIMNVRLPDSWNTPLRPVRWFQIWFHVSNELLTLTLLTIARGIIVFDPSKSDTSRWRESYQCWESDPAVLPANIDAWQTCLLWELINSADCGPAFNEQQRLQFTEINWLVIVSCSRNNCIWFCQIVACRAQSDPPLHCTARENWGHEVRERDIAYQLKLLKQQVGNCAFAGQQWIGPAVDCFPENHQGNVSSDEESMKVNAACLTGKLLNTELDYLRWAYWKCTFQ